MLALDHDLDVPPGIFSFLQKAPAILLDSTLDEHIHVDDLLRVKERTENGYTGRTAYAKITTIIEYHEGLAAGWILVGLKLTALSGEMEI